MSETIMAIQWKGDNKGELREFGGGRIGFAEQTMYLGSDSIGEIGTWLMKTSSGELRLMSDKAFQELLPEMFSSYSQSKIPSGKQSEIDFALSDLSFALLCLGSVMKEGAVKYGDGFSSRRNWSEISWESHLEHALRHIFMYRFHNGVDMEEDHLSHALARVAMAIEVIEEGG